VIRVLHLITTLDTGGAQTMLYNIVSGARDGFAHHVVSLLDGGAQIEPLGALGVAVETLGATRGEMGIAPVARFARVVRRVKPDIVQTWLYHADLLGLMARPLCGARVVWNVRSSTHNGLHSRLTRLCARLSSWPDAVVVNSEAGRRVHREIGYRPRQWRLIPNGFDLEAFRPDPHARDEVRREIGVPAGALLVGLIGRFDPHKDHATFFAAAAEFAGRDPSVHFLLAGEDVVPGNTLLTGAMTPLVKERVHLLGERRDIARLTAALDLATCTSISEGFPNVVGEAMACGVPCVGTDVGDMRAIIGDPALVVPPRDARAIAAAWARLIDLGADERARMGRALRERIAAHYSREAVVHEYTNLYSSLTEGRPAVESR
jgi:glycosyltransferase involved in cell wall biosynthesis